MEVVEPLPQDDASEGTAESLRVAELRRGRWLGQFQVYYQPIIDMHDGSLAGMEALLRWRHPKQGTLTAGTFVPMAERTGTIGSLDEEVLRTASAFRRDLPLDETQQLRVTVNVSAADLARPGVVAAMRKTLAETRLAAQLLEVQVSNLAGATNERTLADALQELSVLGIMLSLDDFEATADRDHVLGELPFGAVKVNLSQATDLDAIAALKNAVADARARGLCTVAKRVETADQLRLLRTLDVQGAQGFALGPPAHVSEFQGLLVDAGLAPSEDDANGWGTLVA